MVTLHDNSQQETFLQKDNSQKRQLVLLGNYDNLQ